MYNGKNCGAGDIKESRTTLICTVSSKNLSPHSLFTILIVWSKDIHIMWTTLNNSLWVNLRFLIIILMFFFCSIMFNPQKEPVWILHGSLNGSMEDVLMIITLQYVDVVSIRLL
jgi:hypothetical protein